MYSFHTQNPTCHLNDHEKQCCHATELCRRIIYPKHETLWYRALKHGSHTSSSSTENIAERQLINRARTLYKTCNKLPSTKSTTPLEVIKTEIKRQISWRNKQQVDRSDFGAKNMTRAELRDQVLSLKHDMEQLTTINTALSTAINSETLETLKTTLQFYADASADELSEDLGALARLKLGSLNL